MGGALLPHPLNLTPDDLGETTMTRIDFGATILALLTGFILSAGLVGIVLAAGGYQMPMLLPPPPPHMAAMGPGVAVAAAPVAAPAQAPAAAVPAEVKVVATDLKFTPPALQAKVGQSLKVTFENRGVIEHDLTFPTLKSDKPASALKVVAKPGQTATLEFTPTAAGAYEYVCTIPGHKEAGMKGTINVAP
jgi:plastocyanin